jgi:glutamate/tyrosine decarboxylase-like PLP-dependent enzyme
MSTASPAPGGLRPVRESAKVPSPLDPAFEHDLDLYFLGPKSEQRQFLYEALQLVLNDHVFWRRNYWPKDPPAIGYSKVSGPDATHFREMFFTELFSLISDLKLDVPVFSPRYMAHMISETTLPSLVAYFATLLYNPNNVSSEASPVTIRYELEVGKQFARLFGFEPRAAFGHLTSGGTVANYESLWFHKAGRLLPLGIEMARREHDGKAGEKGADALYALLNVDLETAEGELAAFLGEGTDPEAQWAKLDSCLMAHLGEARFIRKVESMFETEWMEPVVLVPRTVHYSWRRAASLFGFGRDNFRKVAVDERFRMRPDDLERQMERCLRERTPIVQIVSIVGTTEFGTVDPIGHLADVRDRMQTRGVYAPIHVDGAYGGYFATMFCDGGEPLHGDDWIGEAYRSLHRVDSVTVDPHKAGYTPYGAGSIVIKHGYLKDLVAENAPYCLDRDNNTNEEDPRPQLGKFILEGSKPGSVAASVWFSHRLIPLDKNGYGRQLTILCRIARQFDELTTRREGILSLYRPQLNIVCLVGINPAIRRLSELNELNEYLAERFGVRDVISIQSYDYLVSRTTVATDMPIIGTLPQIDGLEKDADTVSVLRLVFMNRWVVDEGANGTSYLEDFLDLMQEAIRERRA